MTLEEWNNLQPGDKLVWVGWPGETDLPSHNIYIVLRKDTREQVWYSTSPHELGDPYYIIREECINLNHHDPKDECIERRCEPFELVHFAVRRRSRLDIEE